VTTLRRDVATDGRHAVVEFTDDFAEDAARRDLTINAMSCDGEGQLFDPFAGEADLHAGRIRFVGDPATRIREDYLRILRFFRFYGRFGRPPADGAALAACRELAPGIDRLSGERVRQELLRLLETEGAVAALELMRDTGVLRRILPERPHFAGLARLAAAWPAADGLLRLAVLLRGAGVDKAAVDQIASRLRLSTRERDRLEDLATLALPDPPAGRRAHRQGLHAHGSALYLDLIRLKAALDGRDPAELHAVEMLAASWQPPTFPVGGDDLLARGVPPGPELGALLAGLRCWWRDEDFTPDRATCLAHLDMLLAERTSGRHP
jgi:poly(A) polymerase